MKQMSGLLVLILVAGLFACSSGDKSEEAAGAPQENVETSGGGSTPEPPQEADVIVGPSGMSIAGQAVTMDLSGSDVGKMSPLMFGDLKNNSFSISVGGQSIAATSLSLINPGNTKGFNFVGQGAGPQKQAAYAYVAANTDITMSAYAANDSRGCFHASADLAQFFAANAATKVALSPTQSYDLSQVQVSFTVTVSDAVAQACGIQ